MICEPWVIVKTPIPDQILYTPVAQQVEHLTFNLVVDGSNPFRRTKGDLQPYKCETLKSEVRFRSTPWGGKTAKRLMVRYDSVG